MNNSVMKCCICNNEKTGEFIIIKDKKYHLCCIEQLQNNWNKLKSIMLKKRIESRHRSAVKQFTAYGFVLDKMQEIENGGKDE